MNEKTIEKKMNGRSLNERNEQGNRDDRCNVVTRNKRAVPVDT